MTNFKVDDKVEIIGDETPEQAGQHLIGEVGTIVKIAEYGTYRFRIQREGGGMILANEDEIKLWDAFNVGDTVRVIADDHPTIHANIIGVEGKVTGVLDKRKYRYEVILTDGRQLRGAAHELELLTLEKRLTVNDGDGQRMIGELAAKPEAVEHPAHYGGDTTYEVIKVAEAWGLDKDAYLFNVLKYIARAGKKGSEVEDLKKGGFYLNRKIENLEEAK